MILRAKYTKESSGKITVMLCVTDIGDYPDRNIFSSNEDYPSNEDYYLDYKDGNVIEYTAETLTDAYCWATQQVDALSFHLAKWRNIIIPQIEDFII